MRCFRGLSLALLTALIVGCHPDTESGSTTPARAALTLGKSAVPGEPAENAAAPAALAAVGLTASDDAPPPPPELLADFDCGSQIESIAYAPDGKTLALGLGDGTVLLWDPARKAKQAVLAGHEQAVVAVAYSPDGKTLASGGGQDGTVKLWDAPTGKETAAIKAPRAPVVSSNVAFSPDGKVLAVGYGDATIRLWDAARGQGLAVLQGHSYPVYHVAFTPDGKGLASSGMDGSVKLWNAGTGKLRSTLAGPIRRTGPRGTESKKLNSVAVSPDGAALATECEESAYKASMNDVDEKTVLLWDAAGVKPRDVILRGHTNSGNAVAFSPDGKRLALAADEGTFEKTAYVVNLWDVDTGKRLAVFKGHDASVGFVAFSPDGKTLASASGVDLKIWDVARGLAQPSAGGKTVPAAPPKAAEHQGPVYSVAFSPDGKTLASGSADGTIKLWDVPDGTVRSTINVVADAIRGVAFSPDGKTLATANAESKTVKLWDPATGKELASFKGHTRDVLSVAFSPDGKLLASGSMDLTARLWDPATGESRGRLGGQSTNVTFVVFSPDGKTLATPSQWEVNLYDVSTDKVRTALKAHRDNLNAVAFSRDGRVLVSGSSDRNHPVIFWDAAQGKQLRLLKADLDEVTAVALSPDGKVLATGGTRLQDGKPHIETTLWDAATGAELGGFQWHTLRINAVAFSPDGKTLATASEDTTVKLWDVTKALSQKPEK